MTGNRYELVEARSKEDWAAIHVLRRAELFARRPNVTYNENHPDDRAENHIPFVFKLDGEIIGTARLDLLSDTEGAVRLVAIEKGHQRQGNGRALESALENVARSKGIHSLFLNSYPDAVGFYERLGFHKHEWNDPLSRSRRLTGVPMVKQL